ncbi:MAG: TIGR04211 family SH3 domain-containing protein [Gammaproteobacteria bacterium]|nr:TIGR04211 family SH3 domain-containing protein [Gammaproteobacteria bacterium]
MRHFNSLALAAIALSIASHTWAVDPAPASTPTETTNNETAATAKKPAWEVKELPASKQWVSDRLEVPLRSCPGDRCKVVKIVKPGFETTLIGVTNDGWALVTSGDTKGYLPKRYLQTTPVASQQLEGAQRQSLEAMQAHGALKTEMDALKNRAETAETEVGSLRKDNYELKQELDYVKTLSTQTLVVNEDNRRLKTEIEALRQRNDILEQEASDVEGKNQRAWVMVGAGILFMGWIVGRFARAPRRRGWNEI